MKRTLAVGAALSLATLPFALKQNCTTPSMDLLVFEQPGNEWYEGPLTRVTISLDGNWALFFSGFGRTQLYSLATGHVDSETLRDGLDRSMPRVSVAPAVSFASVRAAQNQASLRRELSAETV
jgi:hypothetical protein